MVAQWPPNSSVWTWSRRAFIGGAAVAGVSLAAAATGRAVLRIGPAGLALGRWRVGRIVQAPAADRVVFHPEHDRPQLMRLSGIIAPQSDIGEPFADEAAAGLGRACVGMVAMARADETDRWGEAVGVVRLGDVLGPLLQHIAVARGWARVRPEPAARRFASVLLRTEAQARGAGRGLWREPAFCVRTAHSLHSDPRRYQIARVRMHAASRVRRGGWRLALSPVDNGVSAVIPAPYAERFDANWLAAQVGSWFEARGAVSGPAPGVMAIDEPAQLSRLWAA